MSRHELQQPRDTLRDIPSRTLEQLGREIREWPCVPVDTHARFDPRHSTSFNRVLSRHKREQHWMDGKKRRVGSRYSSVLNDHLSCEERRQSLQLKCFETGPQHVQTPTQALNATGERPLHAQQPLRRQSLPAPSSPPQHAKRNLRRRSLIECGSKQPPEASGWSREKEKNRNSTQRGLKHNAPPSTKNAPPSMKNVHATKRFIRGRGPEADPKYEQRNVQRWDGVYQRKLQEINYFAQLYTATKPPDIGGWAGGEFNLTNIIQTLGDSKCKTKIRPAPN